MSYCTLADVQGVFKAYTITDSSKVTINDVNNDILPDCDQYIDDRLGRYYVVPITGPKALLTMKRIEKYLAAAEVARRTYNGQAPSESPQANAWQTVADDEIQAIIRGDIILYDATPTDETPESRARWISDKLSNPLYRERPHFTDRMRF
ncbi:hypothetical protein ACOALA_04085 [Alicyclobacillus acidoterrestris]|uniref:hypothetical protein n=1 Tax=Alicyclobacillus acidoterrestris TaxID=1450 RepID=UPI003F5347C8